ncbi:unnamed protein product [Miscanthus lutarioriparius]|uniref:Uncharacterized protein n=1 Tax=Miscanthus lutarioriparius TaxID=422564 RepID=A0A811RCD2_9POAL|nr:unnamed protein product [Miscanthus lutarioriparius]
MVKVTSATATIPQAPPMSPKKRGRKPAKGPRRGEHVEGAAAVNLKRPRQGNPIEASILGDLCFWESPLFTVLRSPLIKNSHCQLKKLGLPVLAQLCANTTISPEKRQQQDREDSGLEYNGEDEANSDAHLSDDDLEPPTLSSKKKTTTKKRKTGAKKEQPGMQSSVVTRGMKNRPADVNAMNNQAEIPNQATEEDGHTPNGATMNDVNENGQTQVANIAEDDLFDEENRTRGPSIERELVQMTCSRKKRLPLVNEPGKRRPNSVMIAAKFATECNIAVRQIVPIFPHWKEYKKYPKMIDAYISRVVKVVRQQRYKLKKRYFDALPLHLVPKTSPVDTMTNEQWDKLVEHWKNEKKMVTCEKNRENRSKVQFHQTTGSRSYEMQIVDLADKYKNEPPNALELLKEMHYSKKKGFAPAVQSLIAEIEEKLNEPVDDGLQPKDVTDVVSQALVQKTKNRFLVNVGLQSNATRVSAEHDLEEELVVEKQTSSDLREVVKAQQQQMEEMMKKFQEAEAARAKQGVEEKAS